MIAHPDVRVAKATLAAHRKAQRKARGEKPRRETDAGYIAWLHDGLDCIACLIEGRAPAVLANGHPNVIEAAHQYGAASGPQVGRRPPDAAACPLCTFHHRSSPGCCDPAQRKFWDRLQVDVSDFCRALYGAYLGGIDGACVVQAFATFSKRQWGQP